MTAIRLGTCVLIAVTVLSFGGVESSGNAALEIGAALLFVLWAVLLTLRGRAEIFWNWLFIPVFGLGTIALVQYAFGASFYPYLTKSSCCGGARTPYCSSWRSSHSRRKSTLNSSFGFC